MPLTANLADVYWLFILVYSTWKMMLCSIQWASVYASILRPGFNLVNFSSASRLLWDTSNGSSMTSRNVAIICGTESVSAPSGMFSSPLFVIYFPVSLLTVSTVLSFWVAKRWMAGRSFYSFPRTNIRKFTYLWGWLSNRVIWSVWARLDPL